MDEAVTFLNFAYGSNMLTARLRERVSSARPVGTACLPGFSPRWHKVSVDGSGKCDVVEDATPGACVWGVVFANESAQKDSLNKAEGLGNGYGNREVSVMLGGATLTAQSMSRRARMRHTFPTIGTGRSWSPVPASMPCHRTMSPCWRRSRARSTPTKSVGGRTCY